MAQDLTPLLAALNLVMAVALAAILVTPMVVFYAALAGAPLMLILIFVITLTTRANAPADPNAPTHERAATLGA